MEKLRQGVREEGPTQGNGASGHLRNYRAEARRVLAQNPARMDYQQRYEEIVADYNREKDRVTIEETFRRLTELVDELDEEQRRAVE